MGSASTAAASGMTAAAGYQVTSNILSGQPVTSNVYESAVFGAEIGGFIGAGSGAVRGLAPVFRARLLKNPLRTLVRS